MHAVVANVLGTRCDNKPDKLQNNVKKLFDDNDDGTFNFDIEDMMNVSGSVMALGFKINNFGSALQHIITNTDLYDDDDVNEKTKAMFGNDNLYKNVIVPEYESYIKDHPLVDNKIDGLFEPEKSHIAAWFLNRHPEYFTKKMLSTKDDDGDMILEQTFVDGYNQVFTNNEYEMAQLIKKKSIDIPSTAELNKYEQHLKKGKYSIVRQVDISGKELHSEYLIKDETGRVVGKETKEYLMKARKNDPYGINLFRTGFAECDYVDKEGKTHFRAEI